MNQQKSFEDDKGKGSLFLVPTPIGNLEDMTFRAIRILKEVDVIAAEDTRQTRKLLNHFDIHTKLISYHEHNKEQSGANIIEQLKEGLSVALVSDAGMPAISDPGFELVEKCVEEQLKVIPLPGANAALTALIASGLPTEQFFFYGFLPRQKKDKKKQLEEVKFISSPIIFYEAPHRLQETLEIMFEMLGDRKISVCRELTKKHEEFIRGSIKEMIQWTETGMIKGEFVLIVEGSMEQQEGDANWWEELSLVEHVEFYIGKSMSSKEAIKQVAKDRSVGKREVYAAYHQ